MDKENIVETVTEIVLPIVESYSLELVDVEFIKEDSYWYLRIFIDKEGGISHNDCQLVSKELSKKLDKSDPIQQSYFLEVSSSGEKRAAKQE